MSLSLSYAEGISATSLESITIEPSACCTKLSDASKSLLITTPVSLRPAASSIFLASLANLFFLPSSNDCSIFIIFGIVSLGGKNFSCLLASLSTKACIVVSVNLPSFLNLSPNSCGVSLNPSALLAIKNSKSRLIAYLLPSSLLALPLTNKSLKNCSAAGLLFCTPTGPADKISSNVKLESWILLTKLAISSALYSLGL